MTAEVDKQRHGGGTANLQRAEELPYRLLGCLQTPVWLYGLSSLDLLWANPAALHWMGLASVEDAAAWMQGAGAGWYSLLRCYRQLLGTGQSIADSRPIVSSVRGKALYCLGSTVTLANGQIGLLLEGQGLEEEENHQQAILSAIPDLLMRMTRDGQCLYLVQGSDVVLWRDLDPQQRASIYDLLPHALAQKRLHYAQRALETQTRQIYRQDIEVGGQLCHEEVRVIPMGDGEVLVIVRDITAIAQAERRLEEQTNLFRQQAQRDRVLAEVTQHISQSLDLQEILDTAVTELRAMMQTSRVIVYRFEGSDGSGQVIAEAVSQPLYSLRQVQVEDRCFVVNSPAVQTYRQGRIHRVADVQASGLSACYVAMLTQLGVRANLVLPILQGDTLWGLLVCQQCDAPRRWSDLEVETLSQLANQLAIAIQQSELYEQVQQANQELQHLATHDKLTGLANRRYFDDYLDQAWRRLTQECTPLSLVLLDIDYFKAYNDTYGHLAGDACIAQVAMAIRRSIQRSANLAARYGGEEFAIILPNTNLAGAVHAAEQVRLEIAQAHLPHGSIPNHPYITVSLGIASTRPTLGQSPHTLVDQADQALYQAKQQGRNRYIIAPD